MRRATARIRDATRALLEAGAVPILPGGDDSVPIPVLGAFATGGRVTLLQIDARLDWRDAVQGERPGLSSTRGRASEMPHVEWIVQLGARGVGAAGMADLEAARDRGAILVPAQELAQTDVAGLIPEGARGVVCLDCDALDPAILPAVGTPTAGGLSYREGLGLRRAVSGRATLVGMDMVDFMPAADRDGIGARTAAELLTSVRGLSGGQVAARAD